MLYRPLVARFWIYVDKCVLWPLGVSRTKSASMQNTRECTLIFQLLGTKPPQHIWHCNGTKRPQYWHCNGTGTPPPPWHLAGTKLPPIWHLLGTIRAPCWHKKNIYSYLEPFWHLTGTNFVPLYESSESGLQLQLKIFLDRWSVLGHSTTGLVRPGLPNCMWLLLCQAINNHWALWREAWNERIQWTNICKCPLSYIKAISREFSHLWGVIKVARVTLLPLIWNPLPL